MIIRLRRFPVSRGCRLLHGRRRIPLLAVRRVRHHGQRCGGGEPGGLGVRGSRAHANNPVDAARAAAAIDYLAGELASNPRWIMISPLTKQEMVQARIDVRQALGIAPNAPSQVVVNALLQFASEWQAGNQAAAIQALAAPGFTLPPEQTLRALSNLPYIRSANIASIDAANQMLPGGGWREVAPEATG